MHRAGLPDSDRFIVPAWGARAAVNLVSERRGVWRYKGRRVVEPQLVALQALEEMGGSARMLEFREALGVSNSFFYRRVDALEAKGFVSRSHARLSLTEDGREALALWKEACR